MSSSDPAEIKAFARIIDELNYYEILELEPGANGSNVRDAFHKASRIFHPDRFRNRTEKDLSNEINLISKRITEAYTILRNPRRRRIYDRFLSQEATQVRIPLAEIEAEAEKQTKETGVATTPNGRRYVAKADADLETGNVQGAIRNLQMAVAFEPGNAKLQQKLEALRPKKRKIE